MQASPTAGVSAARQGYWVGVTVIGDLPLPDESSAAAAGRGSGVFAPLPSPAVTGQHEESIVRDPEQPLLWGQWGGVIAIAAVLASLVVSLTLTVGAVPL